MKEKIYRTALSFLVFNAFVVVPLVLLFAWRAPKNLNVCFAKDSVVPSIVVESANGKNAKSLYSKCSDAGFPVTQEFFSDDENLEDVLYRISAPASSRIFIEKIRVTRFYCLYRDLVAQEIVKSYDVTDGAVLKLAVNGVAEIVIPKQGSCSLNPKPNCIKNLSCSKSFVYGLILPRKIGILFVGSEFALLVFCIVGVLLFKVKTSSRQRLSLSALTALVFTVFVSFILPLQIYLSNSVDFPFQMCGVIVNIAWVAILLFLFAFLGLWLSQFGLDYVYHVLLFSFVTYEYFQTGILSIGEPSFNGDLSYWSNSGRAIRDFVVLVICFGVPLFAYHWIKPYLKWMLLSVFVLLVASLFDIKVDHRSGMKVSTSIDRDKVVEHAVFSDKRNVIVLVLDSISTEVARDCFVRHPDIAQGFSGFTLFTNNLGVHHGTGHSTAAFLTGKYYRGPDEKSKVEEFVSTTFGRGVLPAYLDSNWHASIISAAFNFGLTNHEITKTSNVENNINCPLFYRPRESLGFSLFDIERFRLMPIICKIPMYKITEKSLHKKEWFNYEEMLYPRLAQARIENTVANSFLYFHTLGAHVPHCITPDGVRTSDFRCGYDGYLDHTAFCFNELAKFFDMLKRRGIYDKSFIVVIADNGSHCDGDTRHPDSRPEVLKPRAFPLLMVKTFGASSNLVIDSLSPTSHIRLHDLLMSLKDKNVSSEDARKILSVHGDRTFIYPLNGCYDEWHVDVNGEVNSYSRK